MWQAPKRCMSRPCVGSSALCHAGLSPSCNALCATRAAGRPQCISARAGTSEEEQEAVDLEAAARDVWEGGDRLADLSSEYTQEHRAQIQESLLHVLQRHIATLTPNQVQVPTSALSCSLNADCAERRIISCARFLQACLLNLHPPHAAFGQGTAACETSRCLRQDAVHAGPDIIEAHDRSLERQFPEDLNCD